MVGANHKVEIRSNQEKARYIIERKILEGDTHKMGINRRENNSHQDNNTKIEP
jgi:hypothetical protein